MLTTVQEYVDSLNGQGKEWLVEFLSYMNETHSHLKPIMYRQRPMFKVGKSYVFFTVAKTHFTIHTLNFEIIEEMKKVLPTSAFGKGCVKVKFSNFEAKPLLKEMCDKIVVKNS